MTLHRVGPMMSALSWRAPSSFLRLPGSCLLNLCLNRPLHQPVKMGHLTTTSREASQQVPQKFSRFSATSLLLFTHQQLTNSYNDYHGAVVPWKLPGRNPQQYGVAS